MAIKEPVERISYKIIIPGKPIAKKNVRFFRRGGFVGTYNSQRTEEGRWLWEATSQIKNKRIILRPVEVSVIFYMYIPKDTSNKKRKMMLSGEIQHTKKPDLKNLIWFMEDCLNNILWKDDSQIYKYKQLEKQYSDNPRTEIFIQER